MSNADDRPIGQATMEADGTIVIDLHPDDSGIRGIAQKRVKPTDADYEETLEHIGGLKPGEQKLMPPWPQ
jgi:hypothetical protein